MTSLRELLGDLPASRSEADPFLNGFGMRHNPFPAARTIIEELIYNQKDAIAKFAEQVREIFVEEPQRRAMGVAGGTGGGKTHFLRHCQFLLRDYQSDVGGANYVIVEVQAGSTSVIHLVREIIRKADEVAKGDGEYDLLTAVARSLEQDPAALDTIAQPELRTVLRRLALALDPRYVPADRDRRMNFESLRDLARKWLLGGVLTQSERHHLGVLTRLASAAMMTRMLTSLLTFSREQKLLEGVFLCLDEVESLFVSGHSTAKVQSFLQDLRYFFDEAVKENGGYSLLVLSASTQNGMANLRNFNYPLFQRLGFEAGSRSDLLPISGFDEVEAFAELYIDHERKKSGIRAKYKRLLTADELQQAYEAATTAQRSVSRQVSIDRVNQAQLLEALHTLVESKRMDFASAS